MLTGKQLCWSLFFIKLEPWRPAISLKRNSNIGVFLWNFRNFRKHFFYRIHPVATFGNISWTLSSLHRERTMNDVISRYILALQRLFSFIACASFLSISFFSSYFFVNSTTWRGTDVSLTILKKMERSCSYVLQWSF